LSADRLEREFQTLAGRGLREAEIRHEVMQRLLRAVPADAWVMQNVDPETMLVNDCTFSSGVDPELAPAFYEIEYGAPDFAKHDALVTGPRHGAVLSVETAQTPSRSRRYRRVLEPLGFAHELRLAPMAGDAPWAFIDLYRRSDRADFDADELRALLAAQRALARALGAAVASTFSDSPLAGPAACRPATILITRDGQLVGRAGPVAECFEALRSPTHPEMPIPASILSIALAQTHGWYSMDAAVLEADPGVGDIVITIQPAQGIELVGLQMRMLGFTPGERRVCELVLAGASTKLIASRLSLSPYTVQDRLKSVFAKAQVGSRGELSALLSSRVGDEVARGTGGSLGASTVAIADSALGSSPAALAHARPGYATSIREA
jgi:DNA-binding CsgD family transcriptional regulator